MCIMTLVASLPYFAVTRSQILWTPNAEYIGGEVLQHFWSYGDDDVCHIRNRFENCSEFRLLF